MSGDTRTRKRDHLDVFATGQAVFRNKTAWFEHVELVPCSLPDFGADEVRLDTTFLGKPLAAPLMITGMTGGTPQGRAINRALAALAQRNGIAFGVGSQRAMLENPEWTDTYRVRDLAPDIPLAANIGGTQLRMLTGEQIRRLVTDIEADWLCVHINPAQEMVQPEGDRDFSGVADAIARCVDEAGCPVIVKEVGCGISRETAVRLKRAGVAAVDVAGAGGTSWVGLELLRRGQVKHYELETFWEWGIPTAAALEEAAGLELVLLASGGIRFGTDVCKALALGASLAGVAGPILTAYFQGGDVAAAEWLDDLLDGLRRAMLLTGCRTVADCARAPVVRSGPLAAWRTSRGLSP